MTTSRVTVLSIVSIVLICVAPSPAQRKLQTPFSGSLSVGPYAVGFRTLYQFDRTRTWSATRGSDRPFKPDLNGRPIRTSVWYPAMIDSRSRQMRFENYVKPTVPRSVPQEFAELNTIIELR